MEHSKPSISLAGHELGDVRHVCALFHNDEEEYRVLLPFVREGLEAGDRSVHIVHPSAHTDHLHRLRLAGVEPERALERGNLELYSSTETYLREGDFDPDRMLEFFGDVAAANARKPGQGRIVCRMDWAADSQTHITNLIEFESRVNAIWSRHRDTVVCTYNLAQFSGDAIVDILRTHPVVILGGVVQQNPFYVSPEQFLPEFRARRNTA